MKSLNFALVIHNHQPVDNKDEIVEMIYKRSYLPFIRILSSHPEIKVNLHYTGSLLDWLQSFHPEFIDGLRTLVERGQVEMLGGGYYEPILSVIPDEDSLGQVRELTHRLKKLFGIVPKGAWLAERAWEPQLPEVLDRSQISYTLLDEVMLSLSGIDDSGRFEPYLVESRGKYTTVFPILRRLRKTIPYKSIDSIMSYLKGAAARGGNLAVYADDGEKFGAWPNSYERVYEGRWLESFLDTVEKNRGWLNTVLLSDYLEKNPPRIRTYLSCASYPELMEWSLPASSDGKDGKGFWRLFLAKYPESARMYSKMLRTSEAVHELENKMTREMLHELWKGQCNDAYWHGVFGGLYLSILRKINYSHLIQAQKLAENIKHGGKDFITVSKTSFDGQEEFLVDSKTLGVLASPKNGGSLVELDYKPKNINVFDTLARRQERYHTQIEDRKKSDTGKMRSIHSHMIAKEKGLRDLLIYESGPRFSFLDHILNGKITISAMQRQRHVESSSPYTPYLSRVKEVRDSAIIDFTRSFRLGGGLIEIQKRYEIRKGSPEVEVNWAIDSSEGSYIFSPEINLGSLGDAKFAMKNAQARTTHSRSIKLSYPEIGVKVSLDFGSVVDAWQLPINTVSKSESGYERTLQCVSIMPRYRLDPGRLVSKVKLKISD